MTPPFIDISVPIHPDMLLYPGDPPVVCTPFMTMDNGDIVNLTCLQLGSHSGTHFDAPHHILNNHVTTEQIPLAACYGPARVIQLPDAIQAIDAAVLQQYNLAGCDRLLLKTRNSGFYTTHPRTFRPDYAALTPDAAAYLAQLGLQLVGIDYLSIELFDTPDLAAHKALLTAGVQILETLNLSQVSPGDYTLSAFPLAYHGLDGAPTRAVLMPI